MDFVITYLIHFIHIKFYVEYFVSDYSYSVNGNLFTHQWYFLRVLFLFIFLKYLNV